MNREKMATLSLTLDEGRALEDAINGDAELQPIALKLRLAMQKAFKTKPNTKSPIEIFKEARG